MLILHQNAHGRSRVVCPMPTADNPNQITGLTGTVLMFEMLCLISDYLRGANKG